MAELPCSATMTASTRGSRSDFDAPFHSRFWQTRAFDDGQRKVEQETDPPHGLGSIRILSIETPALLKNERGKRFNFVAIL